MAEERASWDGGIGVHVGGTVKVDESLLVGRVRDGIRPPAVIRPTAEPERVDHPAHYQVGGVEVIDLVEHLPFNRGNAIKYIARAGRKPGADELEDLRKAAWYVQREIERVERGAGG